MPLPNAKVTKESLADQTAHYIREYIIENGLKPGDRLPSMAKLTEAVGVSRPVVREALQILSTLGIVDVRVGEGTFVCPFNLKYLQEYMSYYQAIQPESLEHILEVRLYTELAVVELAIERGKEEDFQRLDRIVLEMELALRSGNVDEMIRLDFRFHEALVQMTGNMFWGHYLKSMIHLFVRQTPNSERMRGPVEEHRRLVECMRKGDVTQAKQYIRQHVEAWKNRRP